MSDPNTRIFGPGTFDCETFVMGNGPCLVRGDGPERTILRFSQPGPAIVATWDRFYRGGLIVENCTIVTTCDQWFETFAIVADFPEHPSIVQQTVKIQNVTIRREDLTQLGWGRGISLTGAWLALVDNVIIYGETSYAQPDPRDRHPRNGTRGVEIYGRSAGVTLRDVFVVGMDRMADVYLGDSQGITFDHCTALQCNWGAWLQCPQSEPQIVVTPNCHFNTYEYGLVLDLMPQSDIAGLFYKNEGSFKDYVGVLVRQGCEGTTVGGRFVNCAVPQPGDPAPRGSAAAVVLSGLAQFVSTAQGLYAQGLDIGVHAQPGSNRCLLGKVNANGTPVQVLNQGTNNWQEG